MTTAVVPRGTERLERIPLALIDTADNVRASIDPAADAELAASIKAVGILQPITVWETPLGRYQVRYGHRRARCAQLAGLTEVPAIVSEERAPETRVVEQLVENLQRSDLTALEEAHALRRILDETPGLTQAALADQLGRSRPWVSNTLAILRLPEPVQQLLANGKLEASHVKALSGLPADEQTRLGEDAAEQGYSAHQLEENARWARQQAADRAARVKASAGAAERAVAALAKAEVPAGAWVHIGAPWNIDQQTIAAAVTAAGYRVPKGWPNTDRWSGCDCRAWTVRVADGDGSKVVAACVSDEHSTAAFEERQAKDRAKHAADQAQRKELRAAVAAALTAQPPHPVLARLMLRRLDGYSGQTWAQYSAMTDTDVLAKLAEQLVPSWDQGAKPLPHDKVVAAMVVEPGL